MSIPIDTIVIASRLIERLNASRGHWTGDDWIQGDLHHSQKAIPNLTDQERDTIIDALNRAATDAPVLGTKVLARMLSLVMTGDDLDWSQYLTKAGDLRKMLVDAALSHPAKIGAPSAAPAPTPPSSPVSDAHKGEVK